MCSIDIKILRSIQKLYGFLQQGCGFTGKHRFIDDTGPTYQKYVGGNRGFSLDPGYQVLETLHSMHR